MECSEIANSKKLRKYFLIVLSLAALTGCVAWEISPVELVSEMDEILSKEGNEFGVLWYKGSDREFDYFSYVYSMVGTKNYKVKLGEFEQIERYEITKDSSSWMKVCSINENWHSKYRLRGEWATDCEGINIAITQED